MNTPIFEPQPLAFLVGKPGYLADSPNADATPFLQKDEDQASWGGVRKALSADSPGSVPQQWGILEAPRRISAVRSLSHAGSTAAREKPAAPRDLETRDLKRIAAQSRNLDDLLREEMQ